MSKWKLYNSVASRLLLVSYDFFPVKIKYLTATDATEQLSKTLSLQPLDGTDVPINTTTHTLKLFGKTITGGRVVANIRLACSTKGVVTSKIVVRSDEEGVAALVIGSVA